jgi:magnesium transporter
MEYKYRFEAGVLARTEDPSAPISLYVRPNDAEKHRLIHDLQLDEHTLASALDPDELARIEFEPDHAAIIFKTPMPHSAEEPFLFRVASVGVYLFKDHLTIVAADEFFNIEGMKVQRDPSLARLALRLIYRSIFSFIEHLKIISQVSDELQAKISVSMENRHLLNLFSLQKSLVYYLNFINSNDSVINRLRNYATKIGFDDTELELLDDIRIENGQCFKQAEIYANILASLMDARASIVNNNLNFLMKTLTIITLAITVPMLVVSSFSMNVNFPWQHSPHAFYFIMGLALLSSMIVIAVWRFKKW